MSLPMRFTSWHGIGPVAAAVAAAMMVACASNPVAPPGAALARAKLTQLQSDPQLATQAPAATKDAEAAVRLAELPQSDAELAKHNIYLADRKVDIAVATARTALAEAQRAAISQQRDSARLDARTREADAATDRLANARVALAEQERVTLATQNAAALERKDADAERLAASNDAEQARVAAENARIAASDASQKAADLQRQIEELRARPTDRGLVLTLGDVLFASGRADMKPGAIANLDKLAGFLSKYPDRTAVIEGHTDSIGSEDFNLALSQRRADSVRSYLAGHGIGSERLAALGKGTSDPVASNDTATGRQQNRRVEVIISNGPTSKR